MSGTLKAKVNGAWEAVTYGQDNEVQVGPDTPVTDGVELWYDTDEDGAAVDQANFWNSAWGIIASYKPPAGSVAVPVGGPSGIGTVTYTHVVGRRYRLKYYFSAVAAQSTAGVSLNLYLDGVDITNQTGGPWFFSPGNYTNQCLEWDLANATSITAGVHSLQCVTNNSGAAVAVFRDLLYVEDLGPVTKAAVNPPAGQPVIATAGNALGIVAVGAFNNTAVGGVAFAAGVAKFATNPISFTPQIGRRYRLNFTCRAIQATVATHVQLLPYIDGASAYATIGDRYVPVTNTFGYTTVTTSWAFDGDGNAHTYDVALTAHANGGVTAFFNNSPFNYTLEDIGPNTSPALPLTQQPAPWNPLQFAAGWQGYQTGNTVYGTGQYRKVGDIVTLRGLVETNSALGTITSNIGTLPPGFRPAWQAIFNLMTSLSPAAVRCDVQNNGEINLSATPATAQWVSLLGISFSVTP